MQLIMDPAIPFCCCSKRLKDSSEQGMDLHSYVEFKRNYRAVLHRHV